jgi:imidazoleglycerol-phosphate dehydratase
LYASPSFKKYHRVFMNQPFRSVEEPTLGFPPALDIPRADASTKTLAASTHDRVAEVSRDTLETRVRVRINLDGTGQGTFRTGVPFLEHMLDQIARHGLMDLDVECDGDLHIDDHHSVEDIGITLGMALAQAVGDKRGIRRYGHAYVPLDEALSRVVIDLSGRPGLVFDCDFTRASIGAFETQLVLEFFQGFVNHAKATLHIDNLRGVNAHHQAETIFKAFGRALRVACELDPRTGDSLPSTKGAL